MGDRLSVNPESDWSYAVMALANLEGGKERQGHYRSFESRVTLLLGIYSVAHRGAASGPCGASHQCMSGQLSPGRALTFS